MTTNEKMSKLTVFMTRYLLESNMAASAPCYMVDNQEVTIVRSSFLGALALRTSVAAFIAAALPSLNIIVVADDFMRMPKGVRKMVIGHETGHVALKHYCSSSTTEEVLRKRLAAQAANDVALEELEADAYAVSLYGKDAVIEGLNYIRRSYELSTDSDREIKNRIKAVKEL